ncbi:MAG: pyruvate formate-lyase-activating protein [Oscillospiraceae bacterium]|nr:pyruvate formate-lyase-activating protein [Oscillospiraceae bacterium]
MPNNTVGYVHSIETFGALDGPGIRYILFLQGCPLKCLYCHNPDALETNSGTIKSVDEVLNDVVRYKSFLSGGGITLSGGEPLLQSDFCEELIDKAHVLGFHVAIDTSGGMPLSVCKNVIEKADLLLLDIKAIDAELCRKISGQDNSNALKILNLREQLKKPVWIRHVVVPGLTLDKNHLTALADYLMPFKCVERIDLLPFHKLGEYKWENMKRKYELWDTPTPTNEEMKEAIKIFLDRRLPAN